MNWEIRETPRFVVYKDGKPIVDERGAAWVFESVAAAQHVIDNWDRLRMPTYAQLQAMSDDEVIRRADAARRFEAIR